MGNCLRGIESDDMVWAGEDWAAENNYKPQRYGNNATERLRLLSDHHRHHDHDHDHQMRSGSDDHDRHRAHGSSGKEVKIRISKRELKRLVGVQGLSTEQLMAYLIINGHDRSDHGPHLDHQRSWRPVLQSIPEVN